MQISIILELRSQLWLAPDLSLLGVERKFCGFKKFTENGGFNQIKIFFQLLILDNVKTYLR